LVKILIKKLTNEAIKIMPEAMIAYFLKTSASVFNLSYRGVLVSVSN
jgi:hypothetical protein